MSRPMMTATSRSSSSSTYASATTTLTLERPSQAPFSSPSQQAQETLVLKLNRKKKKVSWKEGTVDNEFLHKKSSKKCCIFHKEKPFDEDDSDDEDGDVGPHGHHCCSDRSNNTGEAHDHASSSGSC